MHTVITTDAVSTTHTMFGKLHRENGPAQIYPDGAQHWYRNGELHLEDGPAVEDLRCSAPAIISANGNQYWYLDGAMQSKLKLI